MSAYDPSRKWRDVRNESEMDPRNFGTNSALFNAAGEFPMPLFGSIGGKHDARGKHFCTVP
jgi:hypothetical protein